MKRVTTWHSQSMQGLAFAPYEEAIQVFNSNGSMIFGPICPSEELRLVRPHDAP